MVLMSERTAEVVDRAVPGHWERDLILGKRSQPAVGTLVERQTRIVVLVNLSGGRLAERVKDALADTIRVLPDHLRRSLICDRGKEMGEHVRFTHDTGMQSYFCDPPSLWQRATNENSNGLVRQYFPKGTACPGRGRARIPLHPTPSAPRPERVGARRPLGEPPGGGALGPLRVPWWPASIPMSRASCFSRRGGVYVRCGIGGIAQGPAPPRGASPGAEFIAGRGGRGPGPGPPAPAARPRRRAFSGDGVRVGYALARLQRIG
jgi:hypothetical protein